MNHAILNGKLIKESKANISVLDKGYFFDFCVYSALKVIGGEVFFKDYHVDRLFESAKILDLNHNFKKEEVLEWIDRLIKKNKTKDALVRLLLIGDVDENKNAKLFILQVSGLTYYKNEMYSQGAKVITFEGERLFPQAKTKNLMPGFLALRKAREAGALEALMIDKDGCIREGSRSNFYAVKDKTIYMPPKNKCLGGITKKMLLESCKEEFDFVEQDIKLSDIKNYDGIFITSTSMNVVPIRYIDDIDMGENFDNAKRIGKLYKEYVKSL